MSYYWLLITFPWFGTASPQYINTGEFVPKAISDPIDVTLSYPLPYSHYFNLPRNEYEIYENDAKNFNQFYHPLQLENLEQSERLDLQRKKRTPENDNNIKGETQDQQWLPNLVDSDKTMYLKNYENTIGSPYIVQGFAGTNKINDNDTNVLGFIEKRSFSPWGGKRGTPIDQMWTWKRAANIREPSLPKRVRFSPWGGKRSGQLIYKPGAKGSKIIFSSAYAPELTRIISKYSPRSVRLNLAGLQFVPTSDTQHPFKIFAFSKKLGNMRQIREAMPFSSFLETVPKVYKPGHPYVGINLNKDGKRKVMFSTWGGKRSPPIIGPIWTPTTQNIKDSALNAILSSRNSPDTYK